MHSCEGHQCILGSAYFAVLDGLLGNDVSSALITICNGLMVEQQVADFFEQVGAERREQQARLILQTAWGAMMQDSQVIALMARILGQIPPPRRDSFIEKMMVLVHDSNKRPTLEDLEAMAQYVMGRMKNAN